MQAAIELFIAQGFEATTTDQIAERADVSPRTLFRAFPTKDALLFHDLERRLATIATRLDERPAGEPLVASIVHVLCATIAEIETSPQDRALLERLTADGSMRRPSIRRYQRSTIVEHGERRIIELLAERAGTTPDDLGCGHRRQRVHLLRRCVRGLAGRPRRRLPGELPAHPRRRRSRPRRLPRLSRAIRPSGPAERSGR